MRILRLPMHLTKRPNACSFQATRTDKYMRRIPIVVLGLALFISTALGNPSRFVIDDDEYLDSITSACQKLLREGKLKSLSTLRSQLHTKGSPVKLSAIAREKLAPAELCER